MNSIKKSFAIVLALMLCVACIIPGVSAAEGSVSGIINAAEKMAYISLDLPENADEAVSLVCYDPTYDAANPEASICYIDQYDLDADGKANIAFPVANFIEGTYTFQIGTTDGYVWGVLEAEEFIAYTDKDVYEVDEEIVITVIGPDTYTKARVYNENGSRIGVASSSYVQLNGYRVWTIVTSLGSKGAGRVLDVILVDSDSDTVQENAVSFDVVSAAPVAYDVDAPDAVAPKQKFNVEVKTNSTVTKLYFTNEVGSAIGRTLVSKTVDNGVITWTYEISIGTAGLGREITIDAYTVDAERLPIDSFAIDVVA